MVKIKICGLTSVSDALLATELGADLLGFIFYTKSPRCVSPEQVRKIVSELPGSILKIGVFVNQNPQQVSEVISHCGLDGIQLHGHERIEDYFSLSLPIIKAKVSLNKISHFPLRKRDFVLLDSALGENKVSERQNQSFEDPAHLIGEKEFFSDVDVLLRRRLFISGGLGGENVARLVSKIQPYGVDVCRFVESSPGRKDKEKMKSFIAQARLGSLETGDFTG